jgi:hypothetical protein
MDSTSVDGTTPVGYRIVQLIGQTIAGLATLLRGTYRDADQTIRSLISELTTIQSAITNLDVLSRDRWFNSSHCTEYDEGLNMALDGCKAIMEVLSGEVAAFVPDDRIDENVAINMRTWPRATWNESLMGEFQVRLQAQVPALQLLLQARKWYAMSMCQGIQVANLSQPYIARTSRTVTAGRGTENFPAGCR